ncbi:Putative inner membrane protein [Salmonella enterica subsp. enterica serovar Daytona]|uniref:Inner membrane protein n=1 Tax=Salmonella enterica subsp. enterica serovar Daytona TaxID=1962639 RepID=A0A447JM63_SALET|nr:Putative inner membrane protein [Salmonella enterica subsp. enterica serovar Daytona]
MPTCAGENRKRTGAFNPLTLEKVCRLKMPPDEVKLAVDLIVLLEENRLPARTVLRALEIVMRDYENKLKSTEDDSQTE